MRLFKSCKLMSTLQFCSLRNSKDEIERRVLIGWGVWPKPRPRREKPVVGDRGTTSVFQQTGPHRAAAEVLVD